MTRPASDWSFARRPRWLVGHLVALIAVVSFVQLGFWQLRRLEERSDLNAVIDARLTAPPEPLAEILAKVGADPEDLRYRRATATGSYLPGDEVILQARSLNGVSGHHVVTTLDLGGGTGVLVERGWVPIDALGPPVEGAEPPGGTVTVTGILFPPERRGLFGGDDGTPDRIGRLDVALLDARSPLDLAPVYLRLVTQQPPQRSEGPLPVGEPVVSEGSHLSYAVQWFLFAAVVAIGYPVLLARSARAPTPADRSGTDPGGTRAGRRSAG